MTRQPVTVLGGRYRLEKPIGGGGMGEVWQAQDEVLNRAVAIKIIRPHLAEDESVRARLRVEAQLAGSLHHPGIVDVFDYGEDEEDGRPVPFLVMPLIEGAPLSTVLADRGTLSTGETMAVVADIAVALQVAHTAGIVHRDLKPGNILVTPDSRVMLVDFGIAHASGGEPLTRTGALIGTADYLSPEQASGGSATAASDLYSLGVVAYACLSGTLPFHRDSDVATALAHLNAETPDLPQTVPDEAAALVGALLAKDPAERPASATAVAEAAAVLASSIPSPPGHAPDLDGEPTMPDAAARPEPTLPGIVERPVSVAPAAGPGAPTLTGGTAVAAAPEDAPDSGSVVAAEHARSRRSPRRMALLGSALLVLAAAAVGWVLMGHGDPVLVPDVVGQSQRAAVAALEAKGLEVELRTVDVTKHRRGEVVKQRPAAGDEAEEGDTVTLSVATGRVRIPLDHVVGKTYDRATAALKKLGLKAKPAYASSDEPAGTVIKADPARTAKIGSTVTLTVSQGGATEPRTTDEQDDDPGQDDGSGSGGTATAPPPTTPAPTTAAPTTPAPTPSPDATPEP
jgi:hypothetical protein